MNTSQLIRVCALLTVATPTAVLAVDGVILIDQNKAMAGNITPGDAPGFPVTISQPGSYRLDGNLTLPDVNTNGIYIQADNVTIDLNGFSIIGPNVCTVRVTFGISAMSCTPGGSSGTGIGIFSANNYITIRNGKIQGTGYSGVHLGGSALIEGVQVRSTLEVGLELYAGIIKDCATDTVNYGFVVTGGGLISNVVAQNHPIHGIDGESVIVTNSVVQNAGIGLNLQSSSYSGNILRNNGTNVSDFFVPSVNTGQNVCDNAICP